MRKSILCLIILVLSYNVYGQNNKVIYVLPDSVELRILHNIKLAENIDQQYYFLLSRDTADVFDIVASTISNKTDAQLRKWIESSNRYVVIGSKNYPLLVDYDFTFGTTLPQSIGEVGTRDGYVKRISLLSHGYVIYFRRNGVIVKEGY